MSSITDEDQFYTFWRALGPKPQTTLRCFERGEIFTLYDSDAILVARDYFQNASMIKHFQTGRTSLPYIIIKKSDTEFLRHFLLRRQYRIEIYCGSTRTGRDNDWVLKLKASPGNLTQLEGVFSFDDLVTEGTGLTSMSIKWWNDQLYVALAFCEKDCRRLVIGEFIDSMHLANLETALVQLNSRECLVPTGFLGAPTATDGKTKPAPKLADSTLTEHLAMIFDRAGILVTELDKKDFTQPDVLQDLNYLLRHSNPNVTAVENKVRDCQQGLACLGAIIKFLDLKADESNAAAFSLHMFNLDNFVRLDSAATRALHLLPGPDDRHRYQSVFGVLNNCRTPQGQRLLSQWLRQPLTDINKIDERLDLVESLVEETSVRQSLHEDFLRRVPDFHRLIRRLQKRPSDGLQDVYRIYQTVLRLPHAINLLHQCGGPHSSVVQICLIDPLQDATNNFAKFQEMVESTIDLEVAQSRSEFVIRADFDDTLGELQNKLNQLEQSIEEEFRRCAQKLNLDPGKSVKLDSNEQLGYFMRVTLKEEKSLREFKSFQILDAQKGGVRFRNTIMSRLNDNHLEVKREYTEAQKSIVDEVLRIATGYVDPMYELNSSTALLDVIVSLAIAAVSSPGGSYVRPKLLPRHVGGRIVFKLMRHPCLEMQDTVSFIPNDVHLERGKQIFLVITGPNMGGKSTYIRGVGVIAAMAQIGSFVPCSSAELTPLDAIMARVGAADCQIRGVSTFMAEMLETSSVLRAATPNSLVIIDELGRGTSTYDGFGLAWAVASHLAGPRLGCFSLFATHFHELTSLAHHMPGRVGNLRVTAHVTNCDRDASATSSSNNDPAVVMLYKVEPGVCNRSYGLDVARLAGLPRAVIDEAEIKARGDEQVESLWLALDESHPSENSEPEDTKESRMEGELSEAPQSTSRAVQVADGLRELLIGVLDNALSRVDDTDSIETFGLELASATRTALQKHSDRLPTELLLRLA